MSDKFNIGHHEKAVKPVAQDPYDSSSSSLSVEILQKSVPKLPHEADQSTRDQETEIRPEIIQAGEDIAAGMKDTDRAPVLNEVYKGQKK